MDQQTIPENIWKEGVIYQIYPRSFCDSNGLTIARPALCPLLQHTERIITNQPNQDTAVLLPWQATIWHCNRS